MRKPWMDKPHEFREDIYDGSMCVCGVPAMTHDLVFPTPPTTETPERNRP